MRVRSTRGQRGRIAALAAAFSLVIGVITAQPAAATADTWVIGPDYNSDAGGFHVSITRDPDALGTLDRTVKIEPTAVDAHGTLLPLPPISAYVRDAAGHSCAGGFGYGGGSYAYTLTTEVHVGIDSCTAGVTGSYTSVRPTYPVYLHFEVRTDDSPAPHLKYLLAEDPDSPAGPRTDVALQVSVARASGGGYGISWTPVEGATGYRIDVHQPKALAQGKYGYSIVDWEFQELAQVNGTTHSFTTADTSYPESHGFDKSVAFSVTALTPTGEGPKASGRAGCAQAYFVSARGSGQNPDNEPLSYEQGLGARGLRVYEDLRERLGLARSAFQANAVNYPAAPASWTFYDPRFRDETYNPSVEGGVGTAHTQFQVISTRCPGALIVGFGFSQGAHVIGNAFQALPASVKQKVLGVQLLGDPVRNPEDSGIWQGPRYDPESGIFPAMREPFTSVTQPLQVMSWCWRGDDICSLRLQDGITVHVEKGRPDYYMCYERWAAYRVTMLARNTGWVPRNVEKPGCTVTP